MAAQQPTTKPANWTEPEITHTEEMMDEEEIEIGPIDALYDALPETFSLLSMSGKTADMLEARMPDDDPRSLALAARIDFGFVADDIILVLQDERDGSSSIAKRINLVWKEDTNGTNMERSTGRESSDGDQ